MDQTIDTERTMRAETAAGTGRLHPGAEILGRYVVESELGQGGMGVVYKCLDKVGGVEVAVKGLPPEVSHSADEMEEVRANYSLVQGLHHPNICGIKTLEADEDGDFYLVMDLGRGEGLNRWMRKHADASFETKLAILRQIAAALDYAHARKVVHRDIKPENVMVAEDGQVAVLDFGLAAQIRSSLSRTSQAVTSKSGTPTYKSPEQWLGQPQGPAADQYALGVIAFRLFTGRLPFDGDDLVVLGQAVLSAPVPSVPNVPRSVNLALSRALSKKPESRFPSCVAFVDALVAVPRKFPVGGLVCAVVVAVLALAAFWLTRPDAEDRVRKTEDAKLESEKARGDAGIVRDEAERKTKDEEHVSSYRDAEKERMRLERDVKERVARVKATAEANIAQLVDEKKQIEAQLEAVSNKPTRQPVAQKTEGPDDAAILAAKSKEDDLKRRFEIDRVQANQIVEGLAPYREEPGLKVRIEEADAAWKTIASLREPDNAVSLSNAASTVRISLQTLRNLSGWFNELDRLREALSSNQKTGQQIFMSLETYRKEPEGFKAKLKEADDFHLQLSNLAVADVASGTNVLNVARNSVKKLRDARDWLVQNIGVRNEARRIADEITQNLDPKLKAAGAPASGLVSYKEGCSRRETARNLFEDGKFAEAKQAYEEALEKLRTTEKGLSKSQVQDGLKAARDYRDASMWAKAKDAAEKVLDVDPANAEAKKLASDADSHLQPYLMLTATADGQLAPGATVTVDDQKFSLPHEFHDLDELIGPFEVVYEKNGRHFKGLQKGFLVNWKGEKKVSVKLEEIPLKAGDLRILTLPGGEKMELVWCPPQEGYRGKKVPGFWMGRTEVTQAQWRSVMTNNPSRFTDYDNRPVEMVSLNDCQKFCEKCQKAGVNVRLPKESEWVYACRAGGRGDWGRRKNGAEGPLDMMGWYDDNSTNETHCVGQKEPNAWGLYDMHGNVWEWCDDVDGTDYILRGGCWDRSSESCVAGENGRGYREPDKQESFNGFRLVCPRE